MDNRIGCAAVMKKFATVGAQSSGKTTTLLLVAGQLKMRGIESVILLPEAARMCPYKLNEDTDLIGAFWLMFEQIKAELWSERFYDVILCDRSVFDIALYATVARESGKSKVDKEGISMLYHIAYDWHRIHPYTKFIFLDTLPMKDDGFRNTSKKFQTTIYDKFMEFFVDERSHIGQKTKMIKSIKELRSQEMLKIIWKEIHK